MRPAFGNPAHELLPADNASFDSIFAFVRCLSSGQHGCSCVCPTAGQIGNRKVFKLSPSLYTPLLAFLRNKAIISSSDLEKFDNEAKADFNVGLDLDFDKLRIEYDPDDGLLTFKMPPKRVHNLFATLIGRQVTGAVSPFVPDFVAWGEVDLTTDARHNGHNKGNKTTDMGWGRMDCDANPPIVAEVAYTNPASLDQLQDRCVALLNHTGNRIRTVIAFKIFCNRYNTNDFEAILEKLDECYVAVWVMYDGMVSNVMGWTPFSDTNAYVCLYTSDMVLDTSKIPTEEVRQFPHSSFNKDACNASPNIRIPMPDIEKNLRIAVHSSILRRDDDEKRRQGED